MKTVKLKIFVCASKFRVLKRLESWIITMGEEALVSNDGIEALKIFKDKKPDILIVSQDLKSMGGIELIEKIKQSSPKQAVIMMVSDEDATLFKRAIDLQIDKYLNIPVEATQLFNAIDSLAQEKLWHKEFTSQKKVLQDYKDAIDLSFSVSMHNTKGDITYVNDLFCITTKLRHKDAMKGLINPLNNSNTDMKIVWDALQTDKIYRDRQEFHFSDNKERIIDITAVALTNDNNEVYEYLVFSNDVTSLIHAARKIKNHELDARLEKLNHAKKLNQVRDSFLTVFTHELKTPLNSIINFSEYVNKHLKKEKFNKKDTLVQQVSAINQSGWFMLDMITNLIEAMKLKDSKIQLNIVSIDLCTLTESLLHNSKNPKNIKLSCLCKKEFQIYSDEMRFTQLIQNILSNAIKYSKNKVEIILEANEKKFRIEILDDGKGFLDKIKVFNLFEQSDDNSMTREATGTGVGLFIVKQICDRMRYEISILDSKKLGGARVVISGKRDIRE